ncbi:peptidoglycan-binding domain-containing protein [Streptomyces sp. NPDC005890]|uniref:peptidoglycan-binding domain-containing protein n=1 Tax=Streptomyces sp. NPDC005890 TaxID=3154568 RepID=UPI0034007328
MTGEQGTRCPECGTPWGADHTPSCDCTERAAEALRQARTAEAAAAEDFDPLRIRPYVEVPDAAPPAPAAPPLATTGGQQPHPAPPDTPTRPLPGVAPDPAPPGRRSRRTLLLAAGGAGTAVVAATAFALLSYHAPAHDRGAQEIRERIPTASPQPPTSAKAPPPPATLRPPAPSASASPTPAPSSPSPSPSHTPSRTPSPTPSTTTASATPQTTPAMAPVLRRGDTGPQVTELQQRLRQLNLYGDRIDGSFTRPVEDAVRNYQLARGITGHTLGEYGPATRKSLEAETTEP